MSKAMGAVAAVFSMGGLSMTLAAGWLGSFSECTALGVVGMGLMASSHLLGGKLGGAVVGTPAVRELKVN
jgi:hypothetical protein